MRICIYIQYHKIIKIMLTTKNATNYLLNGDVYHRKIQINYYHIHYSASRHIYHLLNVQAKPYTYHIAQHKYICRSICDMAMVEQRAFNGEMKEIFQNHFHCVRFSQSCLNFSFFLSQNISLSSIVV